MIHTFLLVLSLIVPAGAMASTDVLLFDPWSGTQVLLEYSIDPTELISEIERLVHASEVMNIWVGAEYRLRDQFVLRAFTSPEHENRVALILSGGSVLVADFSDGEEDHRYQWFTPSAAAALFSSGGLPDQNANRITSALFLSGDYLAQVRVTPTELEGLFSKIRIQPDSISLEEMKACTDRLVKRGS